MKSKYLTLITIIFIALNTFAQSEGKNIFNKINDENTGGDVRIYQTPALRLSMEKHLASIAEKEGVKGYRVQIYFGNGKHARAKSNEARVNFISKNPDVKAYIQYSNPYFKVRVGDFRNKSEALFLLQKIKADFPDAFIVPDIIKVEP